MEHMEGVRNIWIKAMNVEETGGGESTEIMYKKEERIKP